MPNLDNIGESDIRKSINMDDLDQACLHLQTIAGITDGGVASVVFSEFDDEYAWWRSADLKARETKIREYIAAERAYA